MGRECLRQWDPELSIRWMCEASRELGDLARLKRHKHRGKSLSSQTKRVVVNLTDVERILRQSRMCMLRRLMMVEARPERPGRSMNYINGNGGV